MINFKYCPMCAAILNSGQVDGRERFYCDKCKWIHYVNPVPVVSCFVVNDKDELLLVKRRIDPCAGSWALPGGFMEIDETPEGAGKRELFEETGLNGEAKRMVGIEMENSRRYGAIIVMGFEYTAEKGAISPGDDAMAAEFHPLNNLPEIPFPSQQKLLKKFIETYR